ncbi:hypothetical protein [Bilophila wadsworthia]|uniref:hypothetical protein n=1 Tax=Bilophila wadsworthia TaxID=35833 RepID=UPI002676CB34|nr:hypothetical protein [Bilophila wadsworthia]
MSATFFLSRPDRCAGRVPLSLLVYKLIRSGEGPPHKRSKDCPCHSSAAACGGCCPETS